jgi:subtilisin family serine protease
LNGFAAALTPAQLAALRADPDVSYVAADQVVRASGSRQSPATWGLDRIDQQHLPLNNTYVRNATGAGVTAYVIDSGIRTTHTEFGGRAVSGHDSIDGGPADDCDGHGTHVAGTLGGTTYGVAKKAKLVAVRVLDCSGTGTVDSILAGIDWVTSDHTAGAPAVANMSLGGGVNGTIDAAVRTSIADGVTYVLAAGNRNADACNTSPARTAEALTVGSTTSADARRFDSNWGPCLDLFAPGDSITSASNSSDTATTVMGGTSMAASHVAGVAALYLQAAPAATPATVASWILNSATTGTVTNRGAGSADRLLYSLNAYGSEFATWAAAPGVQSVPGDFNKDGFADIALVGGGGWSTIPIAFSNGDGTFKVTNRSVPDIPGWAAASGVQAVPGDFNKDGFADIALTGAPGWARVPTAYSFGDGTFKVTNESVD